MYYCENEKYSPTDKLFPMFTYIVYIPLWIIMLYSFDILTYKGISDTNITPSISSDTTSKTDTTGKTDKTDTTGKTGSFDANIRQFPSLIQKTGIVAAI